MSACLLVVLACESLHVCTVCIWRCEHARFCVEVFYALYINFHSFIHSMFADRPPGSSPNGRRTIRARPPDSSPYGPPYSSSPDPLTVCSQASGHLPLNPWTIRPSPPDSSTPPTPQFPDTLPPHRLFQGPFATCCFCVDLAVSPSCLTEYALTVS